MSTFTGLGSTLVLLVFTVAGLAAYALPAIIAYRRKARYRAAVLVVNVLLGWLIIPWIVALAMAVGGSAE